MSHTLEQFAADCHRILKAEPGPEGRQKVVALVAEVCNDDEFVAQHIEEEQPERKVIYEDTELGFCILAHHNKGAKGSNPHDHGPAWAIYGQASGETEMTDWEKVEPAGEGTKGKARKLRTYTLKRGMAHLYNEGDLHSPWRADTTKLIRIEGKNMEKVKRYAYEAIS